MSAATWALLAALVVVVVVVVVVVGGEVALRCPAGARCRDLGRGSDGRSQYEVDNYQLAVNYVKGELAMECDGASVLNTTALPRAEPALHVVRVVLDLCPLPATGSLADMLAAMNVELEYSDLDAVNEPRGVLKLWNLPPALPLAADHLVGFDRLISLDIAGDEITSPKPGFLAPLRSLRSLSMVKVMLPPGELDEPPPSLRVLDMQYTEGVQFMFPTLEELHLNDWTEPRPAPLVRCDALRKLHLYLPAMITLPERWLANCSRLEELDITWPEYLTALPPKLLVGASRLSSFTLMTKTLDELPADLLDYTPNVLKFILFNTRIHTLLSTFSVARRVQKLDLSGNRLEHGVWDALAPLRDLTYLDLTNNPRLGNGCGTDGYSPIRNSTKLATLRLDRTNVSRICRDWREDMLLLKLLELEGTSITKVSFGDLIFNRTVKAVVELPGPAMTTLRLAREDYNIAKGIQQPSNTYVRVDKHYVWGQVRCDCRMYWTRRVLDLALPALKQVGERQCTDDRQLRVVPPEDMVCAGAEACIAAALPAACTCAVRPDDDPAHERQLVRVCCEGSSLTHVPHPQPSNTSTERVYELLLANNSIAHLRATDMQHNIKGLDLRHNSLSRVDVETATRLGRIHGMLRLAGNPLACDCHAAPLLRALRSRELETVDWDNATCSGGSALYAAHVAHCSPRMSLAAWFAVALGVVLVIVIAAGAFLASRERRFFTRAVLHRWGIVWRAAEPPEDDARRYDVFVTFSHKDEAVVHELIARLEPQYRLCVHYRDWNPGCMIPEQIVESVRESRRTVALVSRHFLQSSWARAEFREAHTAAMLDARPRLIVVLLEEPAALQMDAQLRRYVASHTYLRWGEPWFWHKLAVALPEPREPRTPPPSALQVEDGDGPGRHPPKLAKRGMAPPPVPALEILPVPAQASLAVDASASLLDMTGSFSMKAQNTDD